MRNNGKQHVRSCEIHTDGSVDKTQNKSEHDESRVPTTSVWYGGDTKIHEDDRLGDRRTDLHNELDGRLRLVR